MNEAIRVLKRQGYTLIADSWTWQSPDGRRVVVNIEGKIETKEDILKSCVTDREREFYDSIVRNWG